MSVVTVLSPEPPAAFLAVLADGHRYADWVVGAQGIRGVDDGWPADGARIHHRVGIGPLTIADVTVMEAWRPPSLVVLDARAWPLGRARVTITVTPEADGGSRVTMEEVPVDGPAKALDNPLLRALLGLRNAESMRRLRRLAAAVPA